MDEIEQSSQVYRLRNIEGELDPRGDVSLNPSDNVIEITYFSVANFVHETTHAWQFESGDIAFNPNRSISDGNTLLIPIPQFYHMIWLIEHIIGEDYMIKER